MTRESAAALYPRVVTPVAAHRVADGGYLLSAQSDVEVDGYVLDFLERADGTRSLADITAAFADEVGPLFAPVLAANARDVAVSLGLIELAGERSTAPAAAVSFTGSADGFHPLHATLEIIETCNFSCDHCYYSSSPSKRGRMTLDAAVRAIDLLAERGVRVVELTGGECTVHPDFVDILEHAAARFELVAVITNGYLVGTRPALRDAIAAVPNVVVQVSIDGIEGYHDTFRKHRGAFRAATAAVRELSERGVPVRVACTISDANLDQVPDLLALGRDLGAAAMAFAPVAALGRGCNISEAGPAAERLSVALNAALAPYTSDPLLSPPMSGESVTAPRPVINCGAGSRTYAIDYDGEVRACNFSRDSKKFGNIFDHGYDDIFGQPATALFHNAPSPGGVDCRDCPHENYCRGCFVKAFSVSESVYPQCPWRKRWFPSMSLGLDLTPAAAGPGDGDGNGKRRLLPLLVDQQAKPAFEYCGCAEGKS